MLPPGLVEHNLLGKKISIMGQFFREACHCEKFTTNTTTRGWQKGLRWTINVIFCHFLPFARRGKRTNLTKVLQIKTEKVTYTVVEEILWSSGISSQEDKKVRTQRASLTQVVPLRHHFESSPLHILLQLWPEWPVHVGTHASVHCNVEWQCLVLGRHLVSWASYPRASLRLKPEIPVEIFSQLSSNHSVVWDN